MLLQARQQKINALNPCIILDNMKHKVLVALSLVGRKAQLKSVILEKLSMDAPPPFTIAQYRMRRFFHKSTSQHPHNNNR